jgi:hypothetical protein
MRNKAYFLIFLLSFFLASPCDARITSFTTFGKTCSETVSDDQSGDGVGQIVGKSYIGGYLTALNKEYSIGNNIDFLKDVSVDMAYEWSINYCRKYPAEDFYLAVDKFFLEIKKIKLKKLKK